MAWPRNPRVRGISTFLRRPLSPPSPYRPKSDPSHFRVSIHPRGIRGEITYDLFCVGCITQNWTCGREEFGHGGDDLSTGWEFASSED
jgi:hypothetical protein